MANVRDPQADMTLAANLFRFSSDSNKFQLKICCKIQHQICFIDHHSDHICKKKRLLSQNYSANIFEKRLDKLRKIVTCNKKLKKLSHNVKNISNNVRKKFQLLTSMSNIGNVQKVKKVQNCQKNKIK